MAVLQAVSLGCLPLEWVCFQSSRQMAVLQAVSLSCRVGLFPEFQANGYVADCVTWLFASRVDPFPAVHLQTVALPGCFPTEWSISKGTRGYLQLMLKMNQFHGLKMLTSLIKGNKKHQTG